MTTTRLPKKELTGFYGALVKRFGAKMLGAVPRTRRSDVAQPRSPQVAQRIRRQGPQVERLRRTTQDVRPHGDRIDGQLLLVPGSELLPHAHPGTRQAPASQVPRWRISDVFTPLYSGRCWSTPKR